MDTSGAHREGMHYMCFQLVQVDLHGGSGPVSVPDVSTLDGEV